MLRRTGKTRRAWIRAALVGTLLLGAAGAAGSPESGEADATETFRFPDVTEVEGGDWVLELQDDTLSNWNGPQTLPVRLEGIEGYTPDGERHEKPTLTYLFEESGMWQSHFLSPAGAFGIAGPGQLSAFGSAWEWTNLSYLGNSILQGYPSWHYIAPGLWGIEMTVGETRALPARFVPAGMSTTWFVTLADVDDDGCARLRYEVQGVHTASVFHCGDALAERVVLHDVTVPWGEHDLRITGDTLHLERTSVGPTLPASPTFTGFEGEPFSDHPPDRSDLRFSLDEAYAALESDPRVGLWLTLHPEARAVQGELTDRACRWLGQREYTPGSFCLADPYRENEPVVHTWHVRWTDPDGEWLEANVHRTLEPVSLPPVVTVLETGTDATDTPTIDTAVSLEQALSVWARITEDRFEVSRLDWDLTVDRPVWRIWAEQEEIAGGGGSLLSPFGIWMEDGLALGGSAPPGIYPDPLSGGDGGARAAPNASGSGTTDAGSSAMTLGDHAHWAALWPHLEPHVAVHAFTVPRELRVPPERMSILSRWPNHP